MARVIVSQMGRGIKGKGQGKGIGQRENMFVCLYGGEASGNLKGRAEDRGRPWQRNIKGYLLHKKWNCHF